MVQRLATDPRRKTLAAHVGHQEFHFGLFGGGKRQQRQARTAAVIAVDLARILDSRDPQRASHPRRRGRKTPLLVLR